MAAPVKGQAYVFYITLVDDLSPNKFKVDPTITAGDFQVSLDGSAFVNLGTLPVVTPAGSRTVKVSLSIAEMTADNINVLGIDPDEEWQEMVFTIEPTLTDTESMLKDLWQNEGLDITEPMAVTPTSRVAGDVNLALGGDAVNLTTVTRQ